jgi:hypothetical protein
VFGDIVPFGAGAVEPLAIIPTDINVKVPCRLLLSRDDNGNIMHGWVEIEGDIDGGEEVIEEVAC